MKRHLPGLLSLILPLLSIAQCPFPLGISTSKDFCVGSSLLLTSSHTLKKITWYRNGQQLDSAIATSSLDTIGTIVANTFLESICTDNQDNLYVSNGNYAIEEYKPGDLNGAVVAGGHGQGSALNQTFAPESIYVDADDNILECDMNNYRVQKWQPGAPAGVTLFTFANDFYTFAPHATLFDCRGNTFMIDYVDSTVQVWAAGSTIPVTYAPLPPFWHGYYAGQIELQEDGAGNVLLLDGTPNVVWRWNAGSASWTKISGIPLASTAIPTSTTAIDFWADGDDTVYILNVVTDQLIKYGPGDQTGIPLINGSTGGFSYPLCVVRDNKGDFFIGSQEDKRVMKYKLSSIIDTTFTPTEPGQYYAVVKDILGNTQTTDTIYINTPQAGPPGIGITATATSTPVCTPISFTATTTNAGPDASLQWEVSGVKAGDGSPGYSNNLFANGDQIDCILTTAVGCTGARTNDTSNIITLQIDPQGAASVTIAASDTSVCQGSPVVFDATVTNGAMQPTFQWLLDGHPIPGDDTAAYHTDSLANGDVITCIITSDDACGLAKSNSIPLEVSLPPTIASGQLYTILHGQQVTLEPEVTGTILSWLWTPGAGLSDSAIENPAAFPATTTNYKLKIVTAGCGSDSAYFLVDVYTPVSLPGAFTPNGDGHNDIFYVLGGPVNSKVEDFAVFDRWGATVFQTHDAAPGDPSRGWNGYFHGQPAPSGTYVYQLMMRYADGSRQTYKGTVLVIR